MTRTFSIGLMGPPSARRQLVGYQFWIAAAVVGLVPLSQSAVAEPRAVVELFTSQGCSSCPPADKVLSELKGDPAILALSLPIDYWDYLGWKDTLADPHHTARQKAYSHMRGDRDVYTPQAVVNGTIQVPGSDRTAIERAVTQSRRNAAVLSVPINVTVADGRLTATVSAGKAETGVVWLCPIIGSVPVAIGRGENQGRTVTYSNVVRDWIRLGTWTGQNQTWSVPLSELKAKNADAVAVIIQSGSADKPGEMLGAATAALR